MALKNLIWVFTNEAKPEEKVIVHDANSARMLGQILKNHPNVWIKKETYDGELPEASPIVLAQPTKTLVTKPGKPSGAARPFTRTLAPQVELIKPEPHKPEPKAARVEERRTQKRYSVDLRVILICGEKSFRSISKNVSLGGIMLKNSVPEDFIKKRCFVYLSNSDARENIEMICQVVPDPTDINRIQFAEIDASQLLRLMEWLERNESALKS